MPNRRQLPHEVAHKPLVCDLRRIAKPPKNRWLNVRSISVAMIGSHLQRRSAIRPACRSPDTCCTLRECPLWASISHILGRCQTLPNPALFLILSATHARLAPPPVSRDRGLCTGAARLGLVTLLQSFRALIGLCWCCLRSNRPARAHGVPPLRPSGLGYIPHAAARH